MNNLVLSTFLALNNGLIGGWTPSPLEFRSAVRFQGAASGCSGVKIARYVFMTAAHCFYNEKARLEPLSSEMKIHTHFAPAQKVRIKKVYIHTTYSSETLLLNNKNEVKNSYDLAVIVVGNETPYIQEAPIDFNYVHEDEVVRLSGFGCEIGRTSTTGHNQKFHVGEAVTINTENEKYIFITSGQVGGCPGDSGGPAFNLAGDIIGINSKAGTKNSSGRDNNSMVITRLDSQKSWITEVLALGENLNN